MPTRYAEPALSMLTGLLAEPVAGWSGILGGDVERTRNTLTYQPRTKEGREGMAALGGFLSTAKRKLVDENPPVKAGLDGYNALADRIGEYSPALGAAAQTAPDAIGLLAMPGAMGAMRSVGRAAEHIGNTGVRGPLAGQDGMIGFKPEPTDALRLQSDQVRAAVKRQMTPDAIDALKQYGSPDDAPLAEIMKVLKKR